MTEESNNEASAVDVFTHSSTGFPGAWTEDDIHVLLESWEEVIEEARTPTKRSDAAYKVLLRLRKKGFKQVDKEEVRRQMSTLHTEYKTYLGLKKIGIPTVKAKCFNKLQNILGESPLDRSSRIRTSSVNNADHSEESDSTLTVRVSESAEDKEPSLSQQSADAAGEGDPTGISGRRRRFRRRVNVSKLLQQQQTLLTDIQKVGEANEGSNSKIVSLLTELVSLEKDSVSNQDKIIQYFKTLQL